MTISMARFKRICATPVMKSSVFIVEAELDDEVDDALDGVAVVARELETKKEMSVN